MRKIIITIIVFGMITSAMSQYTTGTHGIGGGSLRIDTNSTTVTLTLTGPSNKWLAVGFGSSATTMATCTDMFIWNDTADRDYTTNTLSNSGHNMPTPDADQSWTIVSDNVSSGIRTVVATRALVSPGDFTFLNDSSFFQFIVAQGDTTTLAYHGTSNMHNTEALDRSFWLALEDFSAVAPSLYPNPTKGDFTIKSKTRIDKIIIYSQTGAVVKTIEIDNPKEDNEINLSGLAVGMYVLELQNGNQKFYKNLIVE